MNFDEIVYSNVNVNVNLKSIQRIVAEPLIESYA